ncbi:blastula protease 10-like [Homarus americanus]|uniref:blastula protease 10-like n=1 Tax=Homarus americanus TaxID=6706 RepID=UPI001C489D87|nr:blastula protease 10-like [Homarus americanus]
MVVEGNWSPRVVVLACMVWSVWGGRCALPPSHQHLQEPRLRVAEEGGEGGRRGPGVSRVQSGYGSGVRVRRKAADSTQLWPDAIIPYTFLAPEPEKKIVLEGLAHWEKHTCLRFLTVNDTHLPHLQFRKLSGCRSGVGIEETSGQNISIGDNCNKVGIVVHEVGHAIGFYHEIRRPDRDDHVVVNEKNILKDELFNFYKLHWLDVSIKYDLSSVMHYHTLEWSTNERTTVATKDPTLQGLIGLWKRESSMGLSHRDKLLANKIYGCLDEWLAKCNLNRNPCENEGYLGLACTCVCPPGTSGRTCHLITGGYYDHLKSPCSQDVTYPTTITSPNYPNNYDPDTWCVYRVEAPECQAPEVVVVDFQLGPRDQRDQCFYDYLEVRNESLYDGFLKCGTDVVTGTRWQARSNSMVLYFKGSEGGYRGFKAEVRFTPIPGCCTTLSNTSTSVVYLHTPGYPHPYDGNFHCTYGLPLEAPAKVVVKVTRKGGGSAADPWTCALRLCQPHGRCRRYCRGVGKRSGREWRQEVVLPNVASVHHLQYNKRVSPFRAENGAFQVSLTLEESPCHKVSLNSPWNTT